MLAQSSQTITPIGAVLGIINGMIGSIALLLPTLALSAGYVASTISIIVTGLSCAFSSWIYFQHLGEQPDIGFALKKHFKGNFWAKFLYDISAWLFLILACIEYFKWIVDIWKHALDNQYQYQNLIVSIGNGCTMLGFVILLKYWQYGAKAMIYGIVSIGVYMIFLMVALITDPDSGEPIEYKAFDRKGMFPFTAAMSQAFMIQVFLIPFLLKLENQQLQSKNFVLYTFLSYLIGGFIYEYIAQIGSFGILHRTQQRAVEDYGILAYFNPSWQLDIICFIYTIHMYSVFPQFLLISKKIFFQTFQKFGLIETSKKEINKQQIIYISSIVLISVAISISKVQVEYLSVINGGIIGCLIIYLIPSFLHLYCMYFIPKQKREPFSIDDKSEKSNKDKNQSARGSEIQISNIDIRAQDRKETYKSLKESLLSSQLSVQHIYVQCNCNHYQKSPLFKAFMTVWLIIMPIFGLLVTVESIRETFS